ncbi:uncharacterized protein BO95DRAFT_482654 [Aspergillus brunneoviolaceus CBS 621.78]|uniref:Uncharacterized protein n=1 Tax=Aspergillus brunneoviolaceus CBS 621.78 TaxID=1450534 RepID=A0ACD1G7J6_9EURO|nr:hypothetical protein BO95DRAFT_482654 [Aspergillus brunneoviolaceus CBS 621.78]RAH45240.1 hypothetical protein BO95DRAFT_482654 [Aspergillus brunneoviolaceus CBS 621.78]
MTLWKSALYLYRVESDQSRGQKVRSGGIESEGRHWVAFRPQSRRQRVELRDELWAHLDWRNREPTAFVSASQDRDWAINQAERRARDGETNVRVYVIEVPRLGVYKSRSECWVTVMKLDAWLEVANSKLPDYADFPSSANEYLFLHDIPEDFIVDTWSF